VEASTPTPDDEASRELARQVLPRLEDLPGDGWHADEDGDADDEGEDDPARDPAADPGVAPFSGAADACLPDDFPEHDVTAGAEVSYFRPGSAGIYAMSTVFATRKTATLAWTVLIREEFVHCFVASVAADVEASGEADLLGPVMQPSDFIVDRGGLRAATFEATFASAGADALLPIIFRVAVLNAGVALVVVWAVDRGAPEASSEWDHVVERVSLRCECALH
jgi:hypothetical protein